MATAFEDWLCRAGRAKRLALIAHISPDGDTVGATLALRLAFLSMGKAVDIYCEDEAPAFLRFLSGADCFRRPQEADGVYDTAIAVDVSDRERMGECVSVFDAADTRLVLDHHATNVGFGDVNWIRGGEAAACLMAYEAIDALGVPFTVPMATCLMTGLSTDTGHFQYSCTSAAALTAAGRLLALGVDLASLTRRLYRTQPMEKVRLTKVAYEHLRFVCDGQVGVITLSQADFDATGGTADQADGLVNRALEVEGVRMAVLASERADGIKMSLRAVEPDNVAQVATQFGGGGHAQAAGCTLHCGMDEAVEQVLAAMRERLAARA